MRYTAENLVIHPHSDADGLTLEITPQSAGWDYLSFQARSLKKGAQWEAETDSREFAFVNLSGRYKVESNRGQWGVGGRQNVFTGAAHVLYLPPQTKFTVTAEEAGEFAAAWSPADKNHDPFLITPDKVPTSVRGGDHATRQINDLLPPGSPVDKLVLVEVYTPGGNWSSYPPHKHDVHERQGDMLLEADLEEIYFFKFDRPEGYALQWVYSGENSPLKKAGAPIDVVVRPEENCAVLVPEGYHPVSSPPGYTTYYLNVLAGSAQSLANRDDPKFTWVKDFYQTVDGRVPLY